MSELVRDDGLLKIGIIASPEKVSKFQQVFEAVWSHYETLEEFLKWGERSEIDILIVDITWLKQSNACRMRGFSSLSEQVKILSLLSSGIPTLLLIGSEDVPPTLGEGRVSLLREPIDASLLRDYLVAQEDAIRIRRLRRLFQQVAEIYAEEVIKG